MNTVRSVSIEVSPGELIDRLTILEIKRVRIAEPEKLAHVEAARACLVRARDALIPASERLDALTSELEAINAQLWDIEDEIRRCERDGDFGSRFVELARSVYRTNDRRAAIKRRIDDLLGSPLREEKSYADYD